MLSSPRGSVGVHPQGWRDARRSVGWPSYTTADTSEDLAGYRKILRANLAEPGRFDAVKAMMFREEPEAAERFFELVASEIPALVVMGTADPDFPDATAEARWIAQRLNGELALVEGAGHYPHAEVPDQTAPGIVDFIDRATRGA